MHQFVRRLPLIAVLAFGAAAAMAPAAEAKIRCDGPFQINRNTVIRTPYCEDENLAAVARQYGIMVSGNLVRWNYGLKRQVCRSLRGDPRVASACFPLNQRPRLRPRHLRPRNGAGIFIQIP